MNPERPVIEQEIIFKNSKGKLVYEYKDLKNDKIDIFKIIMFQKDIVGNDTLYRLFELYLHDKAYKLIYVKFG